MRSLRTNEWFFPFSAFLTYFIGVVLAMESGRTFNPVTFFCGLGIFIALFILERTNFYLTTSRTNFFSTAGRSEKLKHPGVLGLIFLAFAFSLIGVFFLLREQVLIGVNLLWITLLAVLFAIDFTRSGRIMVQPFKWLVEGLIISPLMLFLGGSLQEFTPVPLMMLLSLSLFLLYSAISIALQFPTYQSDLNSPFRSFIIVSGWENGLVFHNLFIFLAFLGFGLFLYFGGTWSFHWPVIAMAFVGAFEIFQLWRISQGLKPNWELLKATAVIMFSAMVYFLITGYILH